MTAAPRRLWIQFNMRTMFTAFVSLCIFMAWLAMPISDIREALREFPRRHAEATPAIESVYAFYVDDGHWPSESELTDRNPHWLPPNWSKNYEPSNHVAASLSLDGPYHLRIY